jgi:hypothetical protein
MEPRQAEAIVVIAGTLPTEPKVIDRFVNEHIAMSGVIVRSGSWLCKNPLREVILGL